MSTQVAIALRIQLTLARTWEEGRDFEQQLKQQKHAETFCPICREDWAHAFPKGRFKGTKSSQLEGGTKVRMPINNFIFNSSKER
jgi:hypothetical protein